jgi:hypothetical protein
MEVAFLRVDFVGGFAEEFAGACLYRPKMKKGHWVRINSSWNEVFRDVCMYVYGRKTHAL